MDKPRDQGLPEMEWPEYMRPHDPDSKAWQIMVEQFVGYIKYPLDPKQVKEANEQIKKARRFRDIYGNYPIQAGSDGWTHQMINYLRNLSNNYTTHETARVRLDQVSYAILGELGEFHAAEF